MKTSQSFTFYPSDFLLGTMLLSPSEVGAYIRLLCYQWQEGKLPNDLKLLSRLAQANEAEIDAIKCKFQEGRDGFLRNAKMEEVRKSLNLYKKSRATNGKKGGRPKKAQQNHMVSECFPDEKHRESFPSPSPSPSPSNTSGEGESKPKTPKARNYLPITETLWPMFPKIAQERSSKKQLEKELKAAEPRPEDSRLIESLTQWCDSEEWNKDGGKFIPGAHRWASGSKWDIEPTPQQQQQHSKCW